ncbi:hypothetical protein SMC26_21830 [Actinomadura fulvescens]|uniref:hypothetical protein n=1 Tax=Actinomadura fulvescens TaxID=46160 RepID=UPI0031D900AB
MTPRKTDILTAEVVSAPPTESVPRSPADYDHTTVSSRSRLSRWWRDLIHGRVSSGL